MRDGKNSCIAKLPSASMPLKLMQRLVQSWFYLGWILEQILQQTLAIILYFNFSRIDTLCKLSHFIQFPRWLDVNLLHFGQMWLSVVVNHKPSSYVLYDAFVILLYALHQLLHCSKKLFIEITVEKFVVFRFGICLQLC